MHALEHQITIAATPSQVFEAVTTESGLRAWHTGDATGSGPLGGVWHLGKSGRSAFEWEVTEAVPNNAVGWTCLSGPGTSKGTTVHFAISAQPDGRTTVYVIHSGWASREGNFTKCNTLWGGLLAHLKKYLETGQPGPMFD